LRDRTVTAVNETTTPVTPLGGPAGARSSARQEDPGWPPVTGPAYNPLSSGNASYPGRGWGLVETSEGPDVVMARQLLDQAKLLGFTFQRAVPGIDAALVGHRVSEDWIDLIHIEGFSGDCSAWREWTSSLIVSPDELGHRHHEVQGSALRVLSEVLTWEPAS
jgi:hypothetical protein